jgi:putative ABC transport system permease protein
VQRLPGVAAIVPVLEQHANVIGPGGRTSVVLLGTIPKYAHLGGRLLRHFTAAELAGQQALALPAPLAQSIGLTSLEPVELQIGARNVEGFIGTLLLEGDIGTLTHSPVAVAPLSYAQRLTGMQGRISRIFVNPAPGHEGEVREGLTRVAAGRLNVLPADFDATLFAQAARPTNQSAILFSTISALVGFLFAFNAILFTVPQRRHLVEDLRLDGYPQRAVVSVLALDALVLGVLASGLGLVLGEALSLSLFHGSPGYLLFAFPVGTQRIVTGQDVALAVGGGLLAAFVGVFGPLYSEISSRLSLVRTPKMSILGDSRSMLVAGIACLLATSAILIFAPAAAVIGTVSMVFALLLLLPVLVRGIIALFGGLRRPLIGAAPYLAAVELRSGSNRARSLAIAATGAIAVFGSVAIEGAHRNLQAGLDRVAVELNAATDLWVSPAGGSTLATVPFGGGLDRTLVRLPGVRRVSVYHGSFLDIGEHRTLVVAPPRTSSELIPASQILEGDLTSASGRLREHGWITVSRTIADSYDLRVGGPFTLAAPRPMTFRVAAITTNLGWPPGAIVLNADDYARAWGSSAPSAYQIGLRPGVSSARGRSEVVHALGAGSALAVQTPQEREFNDRETARKGLSRLTQIALLVLIAGVLAMAAAMGATIWQRRPRIADMKVDGFSGSVLWRALLVESALLLGAGCSIGAVFGLYGQILLSHALATVTGFPVIFSIGATVAVGSFLLVTAVAVAIVAVPGWFATRIRPAIVLQD